MRMNLTTSFPCTKCKEEFELGARKTAEDTFVLWLAVEGHGSTLNDALDNTVCRNCTNEPDLPSLLSILRLLDYKMGDMLIRGHEEVLEIAPRRPQGRRPHRGRRSQGVYDQPRARSFRQRGSYKDQVKRVSIGDALSLSGRGPLVSATDAEREFFSKCSSKIERVSVPASASADTLTHEYHYYPVSSVEVVRFKARKAKLPEPAKPLLQVSQGATSAPSKNTKVKIVYPEGYRFGKSPRIRLTTSEYSFKALHKDRDVTVMAKGMYVQLEVIDGVWCYRPVFRNELVDDVLIGSVNRGLQFPEMGSCKVLLQSRHSEADFSVMIELPDTGELLLTTVCGDLITTLALDPSIWQAQEEPSEKADSKTATAEQAYA